MMPIFQNFFTTLFNSDSWKNFHFLSLLDKANWIVPNVVNPFRWKNSPESLNLDTEEWPVVYTLPVYQATWMQKLQPVDDLKSQE